MKKNEANLVRAVSWLIFTGYILALIYFMFFSETYGRTGVEREYCYNLQPFKEIMRFYKYRRQLGFMAVATNLFGNVAGFVPFGFILPIINKKKRRFFSVVLLSFELSLFIECAQLIFKVGSFDVDDLLLNTIGGALGYLCFFVCNRVRRKYYG